MTHSLTLCSTNAVFFLQLSAFNYTVSGYHVCTIPSCRKATSSLMQLCLEKKSFLSGPFFPIIIVSRPFFYISHTCLAFTTHLGRVAVIEGTICQKLRGFKNITCQRERLIQNHSLAFPCCCNQMMQFVSLGEVSEKCRVLNCLS